MTKINIDEVFNYDYEAEYRKYLSDNPKRHKGLIVGALCPFHNDSHSGSFFVKVKTGQYRCYSCGAKGNYVTFRAFIDNIDTAEATKVILKENGRWQDEESNVSLTLEQYAEKKKLPLEFLQGLGLTTVKGYIDDNHRKANKVYIPNWDIHKNKSRGRYRTQAEPKIKWAMGNDTDLPTTIYGAWKIPNYKENVILVEGESDTQTLWYLGFNALGVQGASYFKEEWVPLIWQFETIFIHDEKDNGGNTFKTSLLETLRKRNYQGTIKIFSCRDIDNSCKDPSDLFIRKGKIAANDIRKLLRQTDPTDLYERIVPWINPCLDIGDFIVEKDGIYLRKNVGTRQETTEAVINTLLTVTDVFQNVENGNMSLRVRCQSRVAKDGFKDFVDYSDNFTNPSLLLKTYGKKIRGLGGDNSLRVAKYLNTIINNNAKLLPEKSSIHHLGWGRDGNFYPYKGNAIVEQSNGYERMLEALQYQSGTYEESIRIFSDLRKCRLFRIVQNCAIASLFMEILDANLFTVELWGTTSTGKTKTIQCISTMFGHPKNYVITMNSTANKLESDLEYLRNLPLLIGEAENRNKNAAKDTNAIIMQISEGIGRTRMIDGQRVQSTKHWENLAIIAAENRLVDDTAGGGTENRLLTLQVTETDPLFRVKSPYEVDEAYHALLTNAGHIGRRLVECLKDKEIKEIVQMAYNETMKDLSNQFGKQYSPKTMSMFACIFAADYLYHNLEGVTEDELDPSELLQTYGKTTAEVDKSERAWSWFCDFMADNVAHFTIIDSAGKEKRQYLREPFYGYIDPTPTKDPKCGQVFMSKAMLTSVMEDAEFNLQSCLENWIAKYVINGKSPVRKALGPATPRVFRLRHQMFRGLGEMQDNPFLD